MASSYTDLLRLEDQATGENPNTWGDKADANFNMIEEAIAGMVSIAFTSSDVTLTANNATTDQSRPAILKLTGTLSANVAAIIPTSVTKIYKVWNATTGNFTMTVKTSGGAGVVIPRGGKAEIFCDGTDTYFINSTTDYIGGDIAAVANGDYVFVYRLPFAGTITQTITDCDSGTVTATMKVNSTGLGGGAHSVTTTENTINHTSSNTFVAGDMFQITMSSNSACTNFRFTARFERSTL